MAHDVDPEYATVGGLLLAPQLLDEVVGWLRPSDFRHGQCGELYEVLVAMRRDGAPIDAVLVLDELRRRGKLDRGGFLAREMIAMVDAVPAPMMAPHYAKVVVAAATFRRIELAGRRLTQIGACRRGTVPDAFTAVDQVVGELRPDRQRWDALDVSRTDAAELENRGELPGSVRDWTPERSAGVSR
jgi:replicative DNA helicase